MKILHDQDANLRTLRLNISKCTWAFRISHIEDDFT